MVGISQNPSGEVNATTEELLSANVIPHVILPNIGWETYQALLADLEDNCGIRLAYDKGTLEIVAPSAEHEKYSISVHDFIVVLADELNLNLRHLGSATLKREDIEKGLEPDQCYYIQNEPLVRSKIKIDLTVDPPPDLVVEVDLSSGSLNKFPIYKALGIGEIWRYRRRGLQIFELEGEEYVERDRSPTFSQFDIASKIVELVQQSRSIGEMAVLRSFRNWVREQL